jgi:hypothetical protein
MYSMAGIQIIAKDKDGNIKQQYETPARGNATSIPVPVQVKPKVVKPKVIKKK